MFKKKIGNIDKTKKKKILLISIPVVILVISFITLFATGTLSKLMGNSVTGTYTVKFLGNGGSGSMSNQVMDLSSEQIIKNNEFQPPWPDAKFLGWHVYNKTTNETIFSYSENGQVLSYTSVEGYVPTYMFNGEKDNLQAAVVSDKSSLSDISNKNINPGDTVYLIAVWDSPRTISFDTNGGTGYMKPMKISTASSDITIPPCKFGKKGSKCAYWKVYYADDNTWYFPDIGRSPSISLQDINSQLKCCKTYNENNSSPVRWSNVAGSGVVRDYFMLEPFHGRNIVFKAYYVDVEPLVIKFNANGGEGAMSDQYVTDVVNVENYDSGYYSVYSNYKSVPINKNLFTREGHKFVGWCREKECNQPYTDGQNLPENISEKTKKIELYAKWKVDPEYSFNVTFDANGGVGRMSSQQIKISTPTSLNENHFSKDGYLFKGWYAKRNDNKWYCYTNSAKTNIDWNDKSVCDNNGYYLFEDKSFWSYGNKVPVSMVMYAQWTENKFTVYYNANGGTGNSYDQRITYGVSTAMYANKYTKEGYSFQGWYAQRSNGTWYCYTDSTKHKLGWLKEKDCHGKYLYKNNLKISNTAKPGDSVIMYAQWKKNESVFKIIFNAGGGTGSMPDQNITYGVSTSLSTNKFTRSGYKFIGWKAVRSDGMHYCYKNVAKTSTGWLKSNDCNGFGHSLYKDKQNVSKTAAPGTSVTMTAQWIENKFTVYYNANGGSGNSYDQRITYGVSTAMYANRYTKSGYNFQGWHAQRSNGTWYCYTDLTKHKLGWLKEKDCYDKYLYKDQLKISNTAEPGDYVIMNAQWKTNQFTVRYYAGGGTGSMPDQKITYGVLTSLSTNKFTRSEYKFIGWNAQRSDGDWYCYTNPAKTSVAWTNQSTCGSFGYYTYSNNQRVSKTAPAAGLVRMVAQWKYVPTKFTVRFYKDEDSSNSYDQKITYGVSTKLTSNQFTKSGYTFIGWKAVRADGSHYCYTNPAKTRTGWLNKSDCNGLGHSLYKNNQSVSKTTSAGGIVYMYAQWKKK